MQQGQLPPGAIADAPFMECECGGITFTPLIMMKRISKLVAMTPRDQVIEIPAMKCDGCGKIPAFVHRSFPDFPDELKATSNGKEEGTGTEEGTEEGAAN